MTTIRTATINGNVVHYAMGGNVEVIRTTREDVQAILDTGDRSHGICPPMADWPAEYVAANQKRLGLA